MTSTAVPAVLSAGSNPTRIWGMTTAERLRRIAVAAALPVANADPDGPIIIVAASHVFDPLWLGFMRDRPGAVLTIGGVPVMAHLENAALADPWWAALASGRMPDDPAVTIVPAEAHRAFYNEALRKREEPMLEALTPGNVRAIERLSYVGAYKGVTDILTKYLWPEWALFLTRIAARIGMTPNMVTGFGAILCVVATILFWRGDYWPGMAAGLLFMVLDTVDGKLARCTITSSWWGNVFDHGMDLIHPPFWWWAWGEGLGAWGLALSDGLFYLIQGTLLAGYVIQRLIEGGFIKAFGMHIHVWRRFDSDFRLVTARRNPNMVILFVATLLQRPDIGLIVVAGWTVASLLVHIAQFAQAAAAKRSGAVLMSWLAE